VSCTIDVHSMWQGRFLVINWLHIYIGNWNTFRKISFSFWSVYFLRVFV